MITDNTVMSVMSLICTMSEYCLRKRR